jgi:hypothetical protein
MLSVFASFCALIYVEYILINKTNVCVLIFVICLRNDTACHWKVSRPLPLGLMQILKKKLNPKLGIFPPHDHILFTFVSRSPSNFLWNHGC